MLNVVASAGNFPTAQKRDSRRADFPAALRALKTIRANATQRPEKPARRIGRCEINQSASKDVLERHRTIE
jgi:hypothetical protein